MDSTKKTALIIGGGIGGPVVGMFLKRAGIDAQIYEAEAAPDNDHGYFLNDASNGLNVLRTLGLEGQVSAVGFPSPRMVMWSGSGKRLGVVQIRQAACKKAVVILLHLPVAGVT